MPVAIQKSIAMDFCMDIGIACDCALCLWLWLNLNVLVAVGSGLVLAAALHHDPWLCIAMFHIIALFAVIVFRLCGSDSKTPPAPVAARIWKRASSIFRKVCECESLNKDRVYLVNVKPHHPHSWGMWEFVTLGL